MADTQTDSERAEALSFGGLIDDQEAEKRDDRQLAGALNSFFNSVDRVVTMMRVYPVGHPLLDGLIDNLHAQLMEILEDEDTVFVNVDATKLTTTEDTEFFSEATSEKDEFIWYTPYSDGLLQLEFRHGVTADELRGCLRVINRAATDAINSDDDTVTLMWELQLDDIKYFAVEGFVDAGELEDFGERTEQEAIELIADAAINPKGQEAAELEALFDNMNLAHLDLFTRMQVEANARVIVPELRDQDLAYAFAVEPELVDKLCDEWKEGADLEYRLIEALLSIIRVAPESAGARRATEMIKSLVIQLLESESFEQAVRILELLHDRRELFFDTDMDPLGELVDRLTDPMQIEALVNIFQRRPEHRDAMTRLFLLLGRDVVLKQILGLLADANRNVVALSQLVDIVFALVDESTELMVTSTQYVGKSIYLRRLLSELPEHDYEEWRPTPRLIRKAIDDESAEVRELGLMLDHSCWDDRRLAEKYLVPMSDDPDEGIRRLALERLGDKHPRLFREAIRDTLLARKMGSRSRAELRFLMRIFLESSSEAAEYLRSLLKVKGWFGRAKKEYAKMAAAVLIEADDEEAIEIIRKAADSFLTSPDLKESYRENLRRYGKTQQGTPSPPSTKASGESSTPKSSTRDKSKKPLRSKAAPGFEEPAPGTKQKPGGAAASSSAPHPKSAAEPSYDVFEGGPPGQAAEKTEQDASGSLDGISVPWSDSEDEEASS